MNAYQQLDRSSVWFFIITLTIIMLPWHERFSSIGIILLLIHWLTDKNFREKVLSLRKDYLLLAFMAFFVIQLLWMIFSLDPAEGWHSIEVKLGFVILPILFSTESYLQKENFRMLLRIFVLSCFLSFLYNLGMSYYDHHQHGWWQVLHRMNLGYTLWHPGTYSNYFLLGLFFMSIDWIQTRHLERVYRWFYGIMIPLFLVIIFILISRTILIVLVLFLAFVIWNFTAFIKHPLIRIGGFAAFFLFSAMLMMFSPQLRSRIYETFNRSGNISKSEIGIGQSTDARRAAYLTEFKLLGKYWLVGCGTGSSNVLLNRQLKKDGYLRLSEDGMFTHNQILRTWLETGLLGMASLSILFLLAFQRLIRARDTLGIWLLILFLFNCLFDDIMQSQAGGVFFLLFLCLMLFKTPGDRRTYH